MSYIGTPPSNAFTSLLKQDFSTSATTGYTLDHAVNNANDIALFINFVRQEPTAGYSASGTTLTLTSATSATDDMYCVYLGQALQTVNPANASVGTAQLIDGAVTSAKLASGTGGKVLQVVTATDDTQRSTTSTSFVTASNTLSVNITPSSTSSKIFITYNGSGYKNGNNQESYTTIFRDSTNIGNENMGLTIFWVGVDDLSVPHSASIVDSPNTTSQITYQVRIRTDAGTFTFPYKSGAGNGVLATITAFEIGA